MNSILLKIGIEKLHTYFTYNSLYNTMKVQLLMYCEFDRFSNILCVEVNKNVFKKIKKEH